MSFPCTPYHQSAFALTVDRGKASNAVSNNFVRIGRFSRHGDCGTRMPHAVLTIAAKPVALN